MQPKPTSILSMDVGRKRIGLAGCDPLGITVTALPPLIRGTLKSDLQILKNHCFRRNVKGLVIGLPLDKDGRYTDQAYICEKYGLKIANNLKLPIAWVNEQCSTWVAGISNNLVGDRSGKIDSEAAALLLHQWLNEGPELKSVKVASHQTRPLR